MIAGNLLNRALKRVGSQTVQYMRFSGRTTNEIGLDVSTYAEPVNITGSVQAVPRSTYEQLGLDFQKRYIMIYTSAPVVDLQRDVSGDKISVGGKSYQVVSATDWLMMDGWQSVLCVEVEDAG